MLGAVIVNSLGKKVTYNDFFHLPKNANIFENKNDMMNPLDIHFSDDEIYKKASRKVSNQKSSPNRSKHHGHPIHIHSFSEASFRKARLISKSMGKGMGEISKFLFKSGREFQLENFHKIKTLEFLYCKKLSNTTLQVIFAIISMISSIISYEFEYNAVSNSNSDLALWICFISSIFLWITIVFEYFFDAKILANNKNIPERLWIKDTERLKSLMLSIGLFFLHPNPIFEGIECPIESLNTQKTYIHSLNSIMTMMCLMRIWFFLKFYLILSDYYSPRGQRVSKMNNFDANLGFSLKASFYKSPVISYTLIFILILAYTSYCLRMFERVADDDTNFNFSLYWNNLWCLVITMTTVGYGDIYPTTILGRIIGIMACICGISLISMLVVTVTNVVVFSPIELNVFLILQRVILKEEKDIQATKLVTKYFNYTKKLKDKKVILGARKKNGIRDELMMELYNFTSKSEELQSTFPTYSRYDNLVDILQILMEEKLDIISRKYESINEQMNSILSTIA
jgi:hypothetical protein